MYERCRPWSLAALDRGLCFGTLVADVPSDCRLCGACCFGGARHGRVWGADYDRLGDEAEAIVEWIADKAYLRVVEQRCAQLARTSAGVACSIYERRPQVCRDLERASPACLGELERKMDLARAFSSRG